MRTNCKKGACHEFSSNRSGGCQEKFAGRCEIFSKVGVRWPAPGKLSGIYNGCRPAADFLEVSAKGELALARWAVRFLGGPGGVEGVVRAGREYASVFTTGPSNSLLHTLTHIELPLGQSSFRGSTWPPTPCVSSSEETLCMIRIWPQESLLMNSVGMVML